MAKPELRVVVAGDSPARVKHTVASAAEDCDELDLAYAVRRRLAKAITDEECPKRDLAALTRRLDDVVNRIRLLEAAAAEEADQDAEPADDSFDASAI
jgi:hypothetical protein